MTFMNMRIVEMRKQGIQEPILPDGTISNLGDFLNEEAERTSKKLQEEIWNSVDKVKDKDWIEYRLMRWIKSLE
jgi:hypothetical protein